MLQTRNGKRTAPAIKMAVDMTDEKGDQSPKPRPSCVSRRAGRQLLHPQFSAETKKQKSRSEGALLVPRPSTPALAQRSAWPSLTPTPPTEVGQGRQGRHHGAPETKPDDVHGMIAAKGILTSRGGATSHAAVVARQFGTPAVCGAEELEIDVEHRMMHVNIDDTQIEIRGRVTGSASTAAPVKCSWANLPRRTRTSRTKSNSTPCSTGRMRFAPWACGQTPTTPGCGTRPPLRRRRHRPLPHRAHVLRRGLPVVREMIMATSKARRLSALERLLPVQRGDFEGIFRAMDGLPVIIRLLDPPLHEFLPLQRPGLRPGRPQGPLAALPR